MRQHLTDAGDGRLTFRYSRPAAVAAWGEMARPAAEIAQLPTLLVLGSESYVPNAGQPERYRDVLGDQLRFVELHSGHSVLWDAFDETADAVASFLGAAYVSAGRVAEALPLLERVVQQTDAMGVVSDHVLGVIPLGEGYLRAGRIEDSLQQAQHAADVCRQHHQRGHEAWAMRLLGEIHAHRHPPEAELAEAAYREALALAETLGMRPLQAHCHLGLGRLYSQTGRGELSRAELFTAIALYRAIDMTFWLPQAQAALVQHGGNLPPGTYAEK